MKRLLLALFLILSLSISSFATTVTYGPTNTYSAGGTKMYGRDGFNSSLAAIYSIVTSPANIKGIWVFDQTGNSTTVLDLSGNNNTVTLRNGSLTAIAASTCSAGFTNFAPYITTDATHTWDTADSNDFSATDGAGTDKAFSMIGLFNMTDATSNKFMAKGADSNYEYQIYTTGDKLWFVLAKSDYSVTIGRTYNTVVTAYENTWVTIGGTYSGSEARTGIKLYLNGARVDDTDGGSATYTGMSNGTARFAGYLAATPAAGPKVSFVMWVAEELTPAQMTAIDKLLRQWAGVY